MALKSAVQNPNGTKKALISKNYKNRPLVQGFAPRTAQLPAAGRSAPKPSSVIRLSYNSLPATFFHLGIKKTFEGMFTFSS